MPSYLKDSVARAACDAIVDLCDAGAGAAHLKIYAGSSTPADADAALDVPTTHQLLADLTMSDPAFGNAATGSNIATATASAISDDTSANNTGTARFFRIEDSNGVVVLQGDCGTSGQQLNFNTLSISSGAIVSVTSFTVALAEAGT